MANILTNLLYTKKQSIVYYNDFNQKVKFEVPT